MGKTNIGLLGSGFIANIHAESYSRFVPEARVAAVYGRDSAHVGAFAKSHGIPKAYGDIDALLAGEDIDIVDMCLPNYLHHGAVMKAIKAGKHVIIEKPLCLTLEEADEMIDAAKKAGVLLMYAEELCFAPKYERVRALVEAGAVGKVYQLKQSEKHNGPHSPWFYNKETSGGGVVMDMGCHALTWFDWMNKGAKPVSVYADMKTVMHGDITECDDSTLMIVEYDNGVTCLAEDSWAKHGGMDDRIEVYGTKGVTYADLFRGNSALTYSLDGYDYAMEKAGASQGWTFTVFEEAFNQGYPQELAHFVSCVREGKTPIVTAEDGRKTLAVIYGAYESVRTGAKVKLPFAAKVKYPLQIWKG
ncbi:MAG: Gfo/Idh/MocA family oxidoreductase [Lachnospiraceae bacterium]|jgi:predicted dehydrogenase|nr:Gfo/Idh/MocA family oxidoreductase [Lachnospiraceae bacterium]